jgi:hypothetical protein
MRKIRPFSSGSCSRKAHGDAAERDVDMFIPQKDGRMSRILAIGAAQLILRD